MQLINDPNAKFDIKSIRKILIEENKFISNLFSILPIPASRKEQDSKSDEQYLLPSNGEVVAQNGLTKPSRASSLSELQKRLEAVKAKKLTIKQKLDKKKVKNKIKKGEKKNERNAKKKLAKAVKNTIKRNGVEKNEDKDNSKDKPLQANGKPVFNKQGSIVFSKFDFSDVGKRKKEKTEKDPKKILEKLAAQKEKLKELEEKGEADKAALVKQKEAWKSALAKAEGKKVKDDPFLLKKSVKRQEQIKRKSAKKWGERKEKVEKSKDERQKKREENIQKKRDKKKANKMKKAVKKGKIVL